MPLYHAIFDENKNHYNQHWSSDSSSPPLCHTPHKSDKLLPTAYTVISGLKLKSLLIKLHIDSKKKNLLQWVSVWCDYDVAAENPTLLLHVVILQHSQQ